MGNYSVEIRAKERNSSFELLRVLSMLLIISGHLVSQSGIEANLDSYSSICRFIVMLTGYGHRIGVTLFVLIGCWFMVEKSFKASRVLKLYLQLWFFNSLTTLLVYCFGGNVPANEFLICLFPVTFYSHWFISSYLILIWLSPFLQKVLLLSKHKLKLLLILLFFPICFISSIHSMSDSRLDGACFFIFIYLAIGYYKKYHKNNTTNTTRKTLIFLIGLLLYSFIIFIIIYSVNSGNQRGIGKMMQFLIDYKTIPNVIISFMIFYYFMKNNIGCINVINEIAGAALTVYVVHQTRSFYPFLWNDILRVSLWQNSPYVGIYVAAMAICVYFFIIPVHYLYKRFIESRVVKTTLFIKIEKSLDSLYLN